MRRAFTGGVEIVGEKGDTQFVVFGSGAELELRHIGRVNGGVVIDSFEGSGSVELAGHLRLAEATDASNEHIG